MGLASLALWTWTQAELGKEQSPQLQLRGEHHLVTAGPYAWVRHPLYSAMVGWAAGVAVVTANRVFAAFGMLSVAGLFARAPHEEKMMLDQFGEEYRAYMQRTGRFLPKKPARS